MRTCRRLISTWMAIWAVVLNALLPTVSLAFEPANKPRHSASADWVEICTSRGSSWVQLSLDGQVLAQTTQRPVGAPTPAHEGHCLYCLTHAASFGLLPAPALVLPEWPLEADLAPQRVPHISAMWGWRGPAVRAPPVKSHALFASTPSV